MITKTLFAWPIIPYFSQIAVVVFVFQKLGGGFNDPIRLAHIFQMAWGFNHHLVIYPMY